MTKSAIIQNPDFEIYLIPAFPIKCNQTSKLKWWTWASNTWMTAGSSWSLGLFAATFFGVFFFLFSLVIVSTWMQKKKNCSSQLTLMVLWEVVRIKTFSKFFDTKTYALPSLLIFDIWFYYHFWRTFLCNIYHILRNRKKHLITLLHVMPIMCIIFVVNNS